MAAAAERVYPVPQAEQSTAPAAPQRVPSAPVATVGVPFGQVHATTASPAALIAYPALGSQQTAWSVAAHLVVAQFVPAGVVIA